MRRRMAEAPRLQLRPPRPPPAPQATPAPPAAGRSGASGTREVAKKPDRSEDPCMPDRSPHAPDHAPHAAVARPVTVRG